MRRSTKTWWICILSVLFTGVLAAMVGIMTGTARGLSVNFPFQPARFTSATIQSGPGINRTFPLQRGGQFSFSMPLGQISIHPVTGQNVKVSVQSSGVAWNGSTANQGLQLSSTKTGTGYDVQLIVPKRLVQLKQVKVDVDVPSGTNLTINNNLGTIQLAGGHFPSLDLESNMGAIRVTSDVQNQLTLHSNMGAIEYSGSLAKNTVVTDDMGEVQLTETDHRPMQYSLATDMGEVQIQVPSEGLSLHGTTMSGEVRGQGVPIHVKCTNNMGAIHLQGE